MVENHLNMVYPESARSRVSLRALATLLNSTTLDRIFRCISGSVAVSAYELNALPLPSPDQMRQLQEALLKGASAKDLDDLIARFYAGIAWGTYAWFVAEPQHLLVFRVEGNRELPGLPV